MQIAGAVDNTETSTGRVIPSTERFRLDPLPTDTLGAGEESERNSVFTSLVTGDADIVGLVAYSIYKQNKHDWLVAFGKLKGRGPNDDEMTAYILGESTPRRLATYRHLAQATLTGQGPEVSGGPAAESFVQRSYAAASRQSGAARPAPAASSGPWPHILGALGFAAVAAVAVWLAIRYGIVPSPR